MIEINVRRQREALAKGIERGKASRLLVQPTSIYRMYRVTNRETGAQYLVNFFAYAGRKYGACDCAAGKTDRMVCKHIASALFVHTNVYAAMR